MSNKTCMGIACELCKTMNYPSYGMLAFICRECGKSSLKLCQEELDESICDKIDKDLFRFLKYHFPNIKVINEREFKKVNGYEFCCASVFVVTQGGSASFVYNNKTITTLNGTLQTFGKFEVGFYSTMYRNMKWPVK